VRLLHPQRRPWKALARANFGRAFPGLGAAVMLTAIKPAAVRGLSPRLASYWGALRAARPHRLTPPASMSPQQVAAEPLAGNVWMGARGRGPTQGPVPWAAAVRAWGGADARLRDLRPAADGSLPAALPAAWGLSLAAGPPQPTEWAASADGGWVRHAPAAGGAPRFFTVAEDGRLLDPPPSAPPPAGAAAGCVNACIIDSPPAKGRAPGAAAPLPPLRAAAAPAAPGPPPPAQRRPLFFSLGVFTL
jgi:hypothetical protein